MEATDLQPLEQVPLPKVLLPSLPKLDASQPVAERLWVQGSVVKYLAPSLLQQPRLTWVAECRDGWDTAKPSIMLPWQPGPIVKPNSKQVSRQTSER